MKKFCLVLFFLIIALPALAAEEDGQVRGQTEQQQNQDQPVQQEVEKKPSSSVEKNFQPTERIKADTEVAFPADI